MVLKYITVNQPSTKIRSHVFKLPLPPCSTKVGTFDMWALGDTPGPKYSIQKMSFVFRSDLRAASQYEAGHQKLEAWHF